MNRLRDDIGGDPVSDRGIDLLRGTPPTGSLPALKRRVWASLQQSRMRGFVVSRGARIRAFAVAATIVCAAGTAGAVLSGRFIVPALDRAASARAARAAKARPDRIRSVRHIADADTIAVPAEPAVVPAVAPAPSSEAADTGAAAAAASRRSRTPAPALAAPRATSATTRAAAAVAQERTEVLDALVALRRDHDPARAGALLDRYLAAHRRGALREEAIALATEAADARGDRAGAERLARAYEADYPRGRFLDFARSHTEPSHANPQAAGLTLGGASAGTP
jgi:hypothetical protein